MGAWGRPRREEITDTDGVRWLRVWVEHFPTATWEALADSKVKGEPILPDKSILLEETRIPPTEKVMAEL